MAILSKQIGWSQESNLLWEILRQLAKLTGIVSKAAPKYKVFTALLTQVDTSAPTAIVLENTIGTISFSYQGDGIYNVLVSDAFFTQDKTYLTIELYSTGLDGQGTFRNSFYYNDDSNLRINTQATNDGISWAFSNDILINTPIEIRVY